MEFDIEKRIGSDETDDAFVVFTEVTPPAGGPPRHAHAYQTEVFHIIQGRYEFEVDDVVFEAGPGECFQVQPGQVHAFRNLLDEPSILNFELMPAGKSELFFEKLVAGDFDPEALEEFFNEFDMDLCGPPME